MTLLIYGANGYSGELIAREAVRRGLRPVLAGRNAAAVGALGRELGCESRAFPVDQAHEGIADARVVLNCAGPFTRTAAAMLRACLTRRAHYTDITGEIEVFELAATLDREAADAGVVLCPGVGFDVVPSDCLALSLKQALPDAIDLSLAFDSRSRLSRGTATTMAERLGTGSRVRIAGRIERIPAASRARRIDFGRGPKHAIAIPWGDVSTAYYTTGIPNVAVYIPVSPAAANNLRRLDRLGWLMQSGPVQRWLKRRIDRGSAGPAADERETTPVSLWGEVRNAAGVVKTGRLTVANGYTVTQQASVMIATHLLGAHGIAGFQTPARLMGAGFASSLPGSTAIDIA